MSPVKARELARIYTSIDIYFLTTRQEAEDWRTLALLETTGGPVSDDLLALLLTAWSSARANAQLVKLVAQQTETQIQKQGIPIEYRPTAPNQAALLKWVRAGQCRPLLVDGRPTSRTTDS